jgi:glutathione S-transferase
MMAKPTLYVGDRNYSSWSMRPWLALRWAGLAFEEGFIRLGPRGQGPNPAIVAINPAGFVPVLHLAGQEIIWDTLAICEWANEAAPHAGLWPADPMARAIARSATSEMHSGFAALRRDLPMNLRRRAPTRAWPDDTARQIARVDTLLSGLRARFGQSGDFLFGHRTIADAFYAPVATRFRTYGVEVSPVTQAWCDAVLSDPDFKVWEAGALNEDWVIEETERA